MAYKYRLEESREKIKNILTDCFQNVYNDSDVPVKEIFKCLNKTLFVIDDVISHLQGIEKDQDPEKSYFLKVKCDTKCFDGLERFLIESVYEYEIIKISDPERKE